MPNYIMDVDPIQINIYTDTYLDNLVVANPLGATLKAQQMTPGLIDIVKFEPTNNYAFA